jgi:hypothetical protein
VPGAPGAIPPARSTFHASLVEGYTFSNLTFFGSDTVGVAKSYLLYESDFIPSSRVSISIAAGAVLKGELTLAHGQRALGPGWLASAGASWRVVDDHGAVPYVVLGASTAGTSSATRASDVGTNGGRGSFTAFDFRFGVTVGKTFADFFSPYLAVRVFGGPVVWTDAGKTNVGTDLYHVQPAVGLALVLPLHLDVYAEANPYFERGFSGGIGIRN